MPGFSAARARPPRPSLAGWRGLLAGWIAVVLAWGGAAAVAHRDRAAESVTVAAGGTLTPATAPAPAAVPAPAPEPPVTTTLPPADLPVVPAPPGPDLAVAVPSSPPPTAPAPPAPPTTTTTATTTATTGVGPPAPSGALCGTPSGTGDLGADRTGSSGGLRLTLQVYPCEVYDPDGFAQTLVVVDDPGRVLRAVHLDFGDGTTHQGGVYPWACDDAGRPNPYYFSAPFHTYAAAGPYRITASITTASCERWATERVEVDEQIHSLAIDVYRRSGPRPG